MEASEEEGEVEETRKKRCRRSGGEEGGEESEEEETDVDEFVKEIKMRKWVRKGDREKGEDFTL